MSRTNSVQTSSRSGPGLWLTVSSVALATALLSPGAAWAGSYTAHDEASLKAAIASANADPDPTATITLTADFAVTDPAAIPAATKTITLATGGFNLTGAAFNVAGSLTVLGGGQFQAAGTSALIGSLNVSNSTVRVENGGTVTGDFAHVGGTSTIGASGVGSLLTVNTLDIGNAVGTVTVLVDNGGALHAGAGTHRLGSTAGAQVDMTVTGAGSRLDVDNVLSLATSATATASLTIANGGAANLSRLNFGSPITGGASTVLVTGAGSNLTTTGPIGIGLYRGQLSVLAGGDVSATSVTMGAANQTANLLVSGAGSNFTTTTGITLGNGNGSTSIITLADGGVLNVVGGVSVATAATRTGVLNIGGVEGGPAEAAGSLNADAFTFGTGTGRLNLNHTDTDYTFATPITGLGAINQAAGVTHLTGNSSGFTGTTTVSGGELQVDGSLGGGTGVVTVTGGAFQVAGTTLAATLNLSGGAVGLESGGKLTAATANIGGNSVLGVSGAGSLLTITDLNMGIAAGTVTVLIQNGGAVQTTAPASSLSWGNVSGAVVDFTVTGAGSRFDSNSQIGVASAAGAGASVSVLDGAVMTATRINLGSPTQAQATPPSMQVDGAGSSVADSGVFAIYKGNLDVTGGGSVTAASFQIGAANGTANLLVSGSGSSVTSMGSVTLGGGNNSTSAVTLADGGVLHAGSITLGGVATRIGSLNIGGIGPAAPAGVLDAISLTLTSATGSLNFNHTDTNYMFATSITGGGAINQLAGVTHLTGNSTGFTGTTTVSGGELHVDGTLGGATSSVVVNNGGVLGGSGTIGGNVAVTDGVLAPGNSPGTLTIAGNLTLDPASLTRAEFGLSNVVGGPMNDLVKVGGNLTLDGTIDVSVTTGGVFSAGLYRVMNYGGALTDNGLTVGATPPGSTVTVQTAIQGQVNLVNTAGLAVNFWDGDAGGSSGNSRVDGGDGTWTGGGLNWTTQTGAVNNSYAAGDFVIFAAAPGLVNVGAVNPGGLQFAVDGYHLTGGTITLNNGSHTVRVGDGTADGKDYVAIIDTPIVGAGGALTKTDLGTLILNGANTYSGITTVNAGTLLVNGSIAGGGNATIVGVNGTLGGTGTIRGGAVAGTLAPGDLTTPGTLTSNFNLTFSSGAVLRYRLGQADTVGGALNDLLVVKGNLTLDGTLNVTQSAGGAFGPGVYRLIDYTGTLTDNGLDLGSLPGGFTNTIQTSIAGQVNLVANAVTPPPGGGGGPPPVYDFWDGDAGVGGDGVITGGAGVWRATPANWTTADGSANGAYADGLFAIFAGTGGKVTVDGSAGAIGVSGIQFAADGYSLTGDPVTLEAADTIIRVGDGTSAGAAFTATIASTLTGPGRLDKTDAGTLVLTGANTYAGGTHVSGGTLRIGAGGTTGSIQGDVAVDGALAFDRSDDTTFAGVISGGGTLAQIGGGTLTLTADNAAFTGRTEVRAGTLAVDGVLGGGVTVMAGARLIGTGQVGGLTNAQGATVAPGHGGVGVLTVAGDYVGAGGTLEMEAELGGDASAADRLVVHGATSGDTLVNVKRVGGAGAATTDGILLVQVDGASGGVFTLANGDYKLNGETVLVAGAYGYALRKDATGGDWSLRSSLIQPEDPTPPGGGATPPPAEPPAQPLYQAGAPLYEAYPQTLQLLNGLGTLRQRTGTRQWSGQAVWGRFEGGHTALEPASTSTQADLKADRWKMEFGADQALSDSAMGGQLTGGITAHYGEVRAKVASPYGGGRIDSQGWGVGTNLTWTNADGGYVDAQAQFNWFGSDLSSDLLGRRAEGANGDGYALSVEAGKAVAASPSVRLTPQAQLSYAKVGFDAFTDSFGARVSDDRSDSLRARLGLALDHAWTTPGGEGGVYGLVNVSHEFLDGTRVDVAGTAIAANARRTWTGLAAGGSYAWGQGRFMVYGEAAADTSLSGFGDSYDISGTAGFRLRF